jgi:hypothetical protein
LFSHYYKTNKWGSKESVSGAGSTVKYTENIRKEIPKLVASLGCNVILDAPCGDFNWFRLINWDTEIAYIGGDIVDDLVMRNNAKYSNRNIKFISLNIISDALPKADLWLCRDCLFHLSDTDIAAVIDNFLRSEIRYLLTSTHPNSDRNDNIPSGSFRLLNLMLPPFSFCEPIQTVDDWIEGFPVRKLALWDRDSLRKTFARK